MNWLRERDEKGRLQRFEDKVEQFFQQQEEYQE